MFTNTQLCDHSPKQYSSTYCNIHYNNFLGIFIHRTVLVWFPLDYGLLPKLKEPLWGNRFNNLSKLSLAMTQEIFSHLSRIFIFQVLRFDAECIISIFYPKSAPEFHGGWIRIHCQNYIFCAISWSITDRIYGYTVYTSGVQCFLSPSAIIKFSETLTSFTILVKWMILILPFNLV